MVRLLSRGVRAARVGFAPTRWPVRGPSPAAFLRLLSPIGSPAYAVIGSVPP